MIPSTFDPLYFKTVPPTYSWDQGTPGITYDPLAFITALSSVSSVSIENEDNVEYVGYAPFAYISLSSFPGEIREDYLALERTVDFGDYYNTESNIVTIPGLSSEKFCHVYVMPGLYTITYTRTEHTYYEFIDIDGSGNCLQKYCFDWSYGSLESSIPRSNPITWASTNTGGIWQKKWEFERCEASEYMMAGLYIQPTDKAVRHPLSWQWYNFLCTPLSGNTRNDSIQWLSAGFQQEKQFTWKNSFGPCINLPIEGITWRWNNLKVPPLSATIGERLLVKQITWDEISQNSPKATTWDFAKNNCSTVGTIVLSANKQVITKKALVRVKEIPPTAYLTIEQPEDRLSPLTVRLSPKNTICGSFPIEKIVWDLGDGSPLIEQKRWSNTLEKPFVFSGDLSDDYEDPRNYDIVHSYVRTENTPSTFYASITAYSANTYTSDSAAVMVGPLKYRNNDGSNFRLLQSELTDEGKVLMGQIDDTNLALWRIDTIFKEIITISQTYYYFGYYSADRPLKNGVSVLYKGIYSNSPKASLLEGKYAFTDELAEGGSSPNLDSWYTNEDGVIFWSKYIVHPFKLEDYIDLDITPDIPVYNPYISIYDYYIDTETLINGVSKLYDGNGSAALVVGEENFDNLDIDRNGIIDEFTTNKEGVISWTPKIYNRLFFPGLSGYTRTAYLTSGISKLYDSPYSNASFVRLEEGYANINSNTQNLYFWETDGYGTITFNMVLLHPYPVGIPVIGYADTLNLINGQVILWNGQGTAATPITLIDETQGLISDIDKDGNEDRYFTNAEGRLSWFRSIAHSTLFTTIFDIDGNPYFEYYIDETVPTNGVSLLWNGPGSAATLVINTTGTALLNSYADEPVRTISWQTNNSGILTFAVLSAHPYVAILGTDPTNLYTYYSDDSIIVSKNTETDTPGTLIWDDYSTEASLILNQQDIGDVDGDGNNEEWSTDEFGQISFAMITAHPYKQFGDYWTDEPILSSGVSVLWSGKGTGATLIANTVSTTAVDVNGDGSVDVWFTNSDGVIRWTMVAAHPWAQFIGFTDAPILQSGVTVLWNEKGSGSSVLSSLSGVWDVDAEGNLDKWSTNENGIITWATLTAHPYIQPFLGQSYYTDTPELTSGVSVLWSNYNSSANLVKSVSGIYDFEGDGNVDAWETNSVGVLTWKLSSVHPYPFVGYYSDTLVLTKGVSKLWDGPGTAAIPVTGEEGLDYIDGDIDLDYWTTTETGEIDWYTATFYGYPFLDTQYFTELQYLENGKTVIWSNKFSSATPVANISGEYLDIDNNEFGTPFMDVWVTDKNGVLSWDKKIIYPYQFPGLSGFTNTEDISSGSTILRATKYIDSEAVPNLSGIYLNRQNDLSNWETNAEGIITWTLLSAHPFQQPKLSFYFTDTLELTSGKSVVWTSVGTGAVPLVQATGTGQLTQNEDNDLDLWSTNENGIVSWVSLSVHPFAQFIGFSNTPFLYSGVSQLWNKPTTTGTVIPFSNGIADVDKDGNLDEWSINFSGVITFQLSVVHSHKVSFGDFYSDTTPLVKDQTVIWSGPGTGAVILSGFVFPNQPRSGMIDLDNDGNVDYYVTNPNGTHGWQMYKQYPKPVLSGIGGSYYTDEASLISGISKVYSSEGSGATFVVSVSNQAYDSNVLGDGNLGNWFIDKTGIVTFNLLRPYPYEVIEGYYSVYPELTSGVSVLYTNFGTTGTIAANLTGSAQITNDKDLDYWSTDSQGVITWVTLTAHPYEQFLGFSDTPEVIEQETVLYSSKFSSATPLTYGTGTADIDKDGNIDSFNVLSNGTALWYKVTAHSFLQFPGMISAADIRVVTTPISVAGHLQIQNTSFTYYQITAFDTFIGADGLERPAFIAGNIPVPTRPFEQTYVVLTAADVAPVIVDGITLTEQISVAGNLTIPGTVYTYKMVSRRDGYTDFEIPNNGDILYKDFGSGAPRLTGVQGYSLVGSHSANWSTNNIGSLTINYISAHPYFQFYRTTNDELDQITNSYYTDEPYIISGVSVLWNDYRTGASIVLRDSGIDDIDGDGTDEEWYTDENGIIHFKLSITIGTYFYSVVSRNWFDIQNWHIYSNRSAGANRLPLSSTNVVILGGSLPALVDLNDTRWVQPSSIDASAGGIEFYAVSSAAVTCPLSGSVGAPVRLTGKATLGTSVGTNIYGRYWSSNSDTSWYTLSNWWYDSDKIYQANSLPLSTHHTTIMEGSVRPYVDLDNASWIQPKSISFVGVGIEFFSNNKQYVDCPLIGEPKLFFGNSREGKEPNVGVYWYSETNSDWFALSSWYVDEFQRIKADVLPTSATNVIIVSAGSVFITVDENTDNIITEDEEILQEEGYSYVPVVPYVNVDRTDWVQPSSIDVRNVGIVFESSNPAGKSVSCTIYGDPTLRGYVEYRNSTP